MSRRKLSVIILVLLILYGLSGMAASEEDTEEVRIECEEPNGKNGYYTKKPTVIIYHGGREVVTQIRLKQGDNILLEKTLDKAEKEFHVEPEMFKEGKHRLEVWQEDENGEVIEETKIEREFLIDTILPKKIEIQYEGGNEEEVLYFSKETAVKLKAYDEGSGVGNIYYQIEKEGEKKQTVSELQIELPKEFKGRITAWAEDKAGNRGEAVTSKYIVCDVRKPDIEIHTDLEEGKWHTKNINADITVKEEGIASGIASVRCYFNGKLIKEIEKLPEFCQSEQIKLRIKEFGELLVEVQDYAGNISWQKQKILIDKEKPESTLSGIYANMITSKDVRLGIAVKDRRQLKEATVILKRKNNNEENIVAERRETKFINNSWKTELNVSEDGIYVVELRAIDMAGNVDRKEEQFIVDKTNPIIHYVEELNGKWIKSFEWRYPLSEFIFDLTKFRYEIRLDGKLQPLFLSERKEGKHIFYVKATDTVGNEAIARAEFVIDHTKPNVFIEGVENGETYEEQVEVKAGVKEKTERLEEVWINGEKQNIDDESNIFRFTSDEVGEYHLIVRAVDLAGNQSVKTVNFSIVEKKNILEKVFMQEETKTKERQKRNKKEKNQTVYVCIGIAVMLSIVGTLGYGKMNRPHKREDAE